MKSTITLNRDTDNNTQSPITQYAQDDIVRLIVSETGEIVFHSQNLSQISPFQFSLSGKKFSDVFILKGHDNYLTDGQYHFILKQNSQPITFELNWVDLPDDRRYMVASIITEQTPSSSSAGQHLSDYVAAKIKEKQTIDLNQFQDLSGNCLCTLTHTGQCIATNDQADHFFNLGHNSSFIDIIFGEDKAQFTNILNDFVHYSATNHDPLYNSIILRHKKPQEEIKYFQWNLKFHNNTIYAHGSDVTQPIIQQETIKRHKRELNEAEAIAHMGHWRWNVGAPNLELSDEIYRIFGVTRDEFVPTLDNVNDMIHPEDSGRMLQVFERAIIEQKDYDMDFRLIGQDGITHYIRCEGRCETDNDMDVVALYGIMQDVTDSMQRERDLRFAKEGVERAYNAKTQFLANMSHELRTPLNAIIGFSEMMKQQLLGPIGTEKYLEYIDGILQSGEHLLDLISDILDMSKIEAGKYELNVEKFNLSKVLRLAVHMMEGRAIDAALKLNIKLCDEDCQIVADRRAIMQVILNLLSNAIKFSRKNGEIIVSLKQTKQTYYMEIQDQGIGIPSDKIEDITKPFEQAETDYTREFEGSGLGLAITKELVELHGGKIDIQSQLHIGTTVGITLPLHSADTGCSITSNVS